MKFKEQCVEFKLIEKELKKSEALIVIGNHGEDHPDVDYFNEMTFEPLVKESHYLKIRIGVMPQGQALYVLNWEGAGQNSLERRWLANQLQKVLGETGQHKLLAVYLANGAKAEHLAIAEDIFHFQTDSESGQSKLESFRILTSKDDDLAAEDRHRAVRTQYGKDYRDWVNQNPDEMTSIEIGKRLKTFADSSKCEFEQLDEKQLKEKGLNLLVAVGQASERSPSRLFLLSHNVKSKDDKPLLLVGKGVTFDTGGINVKPFDSFVNCMKNDMGGAALMANLFMALVKSGYDQPLALAIPACENLVAQNSMKPGAVINAYNGKRVVVEHTDAEGRLILADALSYANEKFNPEKTYVAATLTTAVMIQFSNYFTACHFLDHGEQRKLNAASAKWGEGFTYWGDFLPFKVRNKSQAAELTNMGRMPAAASRSAGSNIAAHFLQEFCPSPMVHFDIFGSTWNWSNDYPGSSYGATGAPFNSLFDWLSN